MSLNDFIIIYLACGSPIGVWFYFNNKNAGNILPKSFVVAFFWIIFVVKVLHEKLSDNFNRQEKVAVLQTYQKEIEKLLPKEVSVFKFREILNRYTGLTLAKNDEQENSSNRENHFSANFNTQNKNLSARCLHRNNRQKLILHQTRSRKDFVQTIRGISAQIEDPAKFLELNLKFINEINDSQAEIQIRKLFADYLQTQTEKAVKQREKELWKPEQLNLPTVEQTNFHLQTSTTQAIRMSTKD